MLSILDLLRNYKEIFYRIVVTVPIYLFEFDVALVRILLLAESDDINFVFDYIMAKVHLLNSDILRTGTQ